MVRIGVYTGRTTKRGLSLLNFKVLNELEYTKVAIGSFSLVGRYNDYPENLVKNRIYLVNIKDEPSKPVKHFEILDKCKLIKYVDGEYLITYKKYNNISIIDLYENRTEEAQEFIDWVLDEGKKSKKWRLNTFTKTVLEKLFDNYGYDDVIHYDSPDEKKLWNRELTERVRKFKRKTDDKSTTWSKDEEKFLLLNMDSMSEKELAKELGRTVPSIATKKWKLKHEYKSKLKDMKDKSELIAKELKDFREDQGWSQRKLVEESGVSLSVINQLECKNYSTTDSPTVNKLLEFIREYDKEENIDEVEHIDIEKDMEAIASTEQPARVKGEHKRESLFSEAEMSTISAKLDTLTNEIARLNVNIEKVLTDHTRISGENKKFRKEAVLRQLAEMIA